MFYLFIESFFFLSFFIPSFLYIVFVNDESWNIYIIMILLVMQLTLSKLVWVSFCSFIYLLLLCLFVCFCFWHSFLFCFSFHIKFVKHVEALNTAYMIDGVFFPSSFNFFKKLLYWTCFTAFIFFLALKRHMYRPWTYNCETKHIFWTFSTIN